MLRTSLVELDDAEKYKEIKPWVDDARIEIHEW